MNIMKTVWIQIYLKHKTEKSIFERSYNDYKTALSRLTSIQKQEYERRISGTTADSTDSDTSVEKVHSNSMSRII